MKEEERAALTARLYAFLKATEKNYLDGIVDNLIKKTYKITDEIRIGAQSPIKKDRYDPNEFVGFIVAVKTLARGLDCRFMVKDSMYKQAETFEGAYRDLCVRNLDEIKKIYESKQKENDEK